EWDQFLQDFVSDPATIEIVKTYKLR
ncbi:hypothetical protein FHW92_005147, partial [Novosphingobium sp. SG707]|nr:hypothetical protein [Novosphingobium sp. SG707]NKJ02979.1 hypothetical protein [Novosphingobium sp. SG707]NKJ03036.1 hypothetical protein [Novosphingobium sp. SG707]